MEEELKSLYIKRTQKDYTMSFKLSVVREVEQTGIGVCAIARKYGIQYCCDEYQKIARRYKLKMSMTESYDPYANAVAERVNGILKQEFGLEALNLPLREQRQAVRESIGIYNSMRPHCSCAMLTPNQMHRQNEVKIKTYRRKMELPAGNSIKQF